MTEMSWVILRIGTGTRVLSIRPMSVYYVTHANKDSDGVITDVKTRKGSTTVSAESMSKSALIKLLKPLGSDTAKTYNTATGDSEDIRVIDGKYLRTDANNIKADNLGNLPSF